MQGRLGPAVFGEAFSKLWTQNLDEKMGTSIRQQGQRRLTLAKSNKVRRTTHAAARPETPALSAQSQRNLSAISAQSPTNIRAVSAEQLRPPRAQADSSSRNELDTPNSTKGLTRYHSSRAELSGRLDSRPGRI